MSEVDLDFRPSVPVFDANVALGRRHSRRVKVDTVEGTLDAMAKAGVGRALVFSPHATTTDSRDGNQMLHEAVQGVPELVPQFACNPASDDLDQFASQVAELGVQSVRMTPMIHQFPFRDWMVKPWLDWLTSEGIPLWLPASAEYTGGRQETDPADLFDTVERHPDLPMVLSEVHYRHLPWALPLIKSLENISVDISWDFSTDGISRLLDTIGEERVLFGSRFPDGSMSPQLYHLHRLGLGEDSLRAICAGNLEKLLGMD